MDRHKCYVTGGAYIANNTATSNGGAIYIAASSKAIFGISAVITSNKASSSGGAIYASASSVTFGSAASLVYNKAATSGGGLYMTGAGAKAIFSDNATISNNRAGTASTNYGGGFYADSTAAVNFTTRATISNNSAGAGAAFYLTGASTTARFSFYPSITSNNYTTGGSAAMAALAGSTLIMGSNATIKNNGPSDVYSSASKAYCNPEGGSTPFLYCTSTCTQYYNQTSPYLACYYTPRYPVCDVDTLYASNFTGVTITSIQNSVQLNAALLTSNTNAATQVLSLQPGTYTLTTSYTPINNICIVVRI